MSSLDLGPLRRRWIDGNSTSNDVADLLEEVAALRWQNTQLREQVGRRALDPVAVPGGGRHR